MLKQSKSFIKRYNLLGISVLALAMIASACNDGPSGRSRNGQGGGQGGGTPTPTGTPSASPSSAPSGGGNSFSYNGVMTTFDRIRVHSLHNAGLTGNGVIAAVIDDGVDFRDPSLHGKAVQGGRAVQFQLPAGQADQYENYIGQEGPLSPILYESGGHGTGMAKILAGTRDAAGNRGVAPGARIIPYPTPHNGFFGTLSHALHLGARIANISLQDVVMQNLLVPGHEDRSEDELANMALVIIAGNGGNAASPAFEIGYVAPFMPAHENTIITVAVGENNHLTPESQRCGNTQLFCIAVPAPNATSPTAPVVSGALALLMEAVPGLPARDYVSAILQTATHLDAPELTGRGMLNVENALAYLRGQLVVDGGMRPR